MNPNVKTSLPPLTLHEAVSSINGASSFPQLHYHLNTISLTFTIAALKILTVDFQAYLDSDGQMPNSLKLASRSQITYSGTPGLVPGKNNRTSRCSTIEGALAWSLSGF